MALFVWANLSGVNVEPSRYFVSPLVFGLAVASIVMAIAAYVVKANGFRVGGVFAAYSFLIAAVIILVLTTGTVNSPFLALWLVTALFVGAFGNTPLIGLFLLVTGYSLYLIFGGDYSNHALVGVVLTSALPVVISYILWHEGSKSHDKNDHAYHDLANQLSQASDKADVVIHAINDGVIAVSNDGMIELINPAAQRIVGWRDHDAVGLTYKSVLQLLGKDGHEVDKGNDPVINVLTNNQSVRRTDLQLQTSSGKKLDAEVVVSPIGRTGSGAIIVFRDVTKELAEEHAQAEFISTASHEMRTPVASIEGYLGLALNPATATIDEKARDFITKAHESAQHLGRLFQDLLDVTKADDGRLSNNPKVINVVDFTSNIIEGLQQKADAKNLRIFFKAITAPQDNAGNERGMRTIAPVYFVDLDSDHLREVLSNLVENAIKYTPAGEVVIDVHGDDTHVVVSIADSGIGIPTEDIPHLFQKFYRVDNSDTREIGGTGLGLYLCRRLIETMGGRIWVESEYKKGSTFFVELPRITHEEANRLIEASTAMPSQAIGDDKTYLHPIEGQTKEEEIEIAEQRKIALSTPIVMAHTAPVSTEQQTAPVIASTDPLVGGPTLTAEPLKQAAAQQTHMVLPSNLQAITPQVQYAQPQPTAPAPATTPTPAPTIAPAATTTPPATPALATTPATAATPAPSTAPPAPAVPLARLQPMPATTRSAPVTPVAPVAAAAPTPQPVSPQPQPVTTQQGQKA